MVKINKVLKAIQEPVQALGLSEVSDYNLNKYEKAMVTRIIEAYLLLIHSRIGNDAKFKELIEDKEIIKQISKTIKKTLSRL